MLKYIFTFILLVTMLFPFTSASAESISELPSIQKIHSLERTVTSDWNEFTAQNNIPLKKEWVITFSDNVTLDKIDGIVIEKENTFIPVTIKISGQKTATITPIEPYEVNATYTLKAFLSNNKKYKMNFTTVADKNSLIEPIQDLHDAQIIRVPAMPEEGFNFPYYIRIPSKSYMNQYNNAYEKRYIVMDTANSGPTSPDGTEYWVRDTLQGRSQLSVQHAEQLWAPMIMPATPRSGACYGYSQQNANCLYEHAFDRDIALLKDLLNGPYSEEIKAAYSAKGLNATDYLSYDQQLIAMFNHAANYLNTYGQNVETDKMILHGYSAGGTFTDRLAVLHPTKVKAVVSGATLDDMVLPIATHKNEELIFPIGIADYEAITGKPFNLQDINNTAKLVFMGKNDTNSTLPYSDAYGNIERNIIKNVFGENILNRAMQMMDLYHGAGGQGMFILDVDVAHSYSQDMRQYALEFLLANRKSNTPVYPIPSNPQQLEYKLH